MKFLIVEKNMFLLPRRLGAKPKLLMHQVQKCQVYILTCDTFPTTMGCKDAHHTRSYTSSGWWFQPIWKILVKLEIIPGENTHIKIFETTNRVPFVLTFFAFEFIHYMFYTSNDSIWTKISQRPTNHRNAHGITFGVCVFSKTLWL